MSASYDAQLRNLTLKVDLLLEKVDKLLGQVSTGSQKAAGRLSLPRKPDAGSVAAHRKTDLSN